MNLQSEKTRETLNVTWAGKYSEHPRSFQSLEMSLLLTFPFIERAYRTSGVLAGHLSGNPGGLNGSTQHQLQVQMHESTKLNSFEGVDVNRTLPCLGSD